MTDEEKKNAFLESRGDHSSTSPARATPPKANTGAKGTTAQKKKAKPKVATKKTSQASKGEKNEKHEKSEKTGKSESRSSSSSSETRPSSSHKSAENPNAGANPTPAAPPRPQEKEKATITVEKSGLMEKEEFLPPPPPPEKRSWFFFHRTPEYKYLTPAIRAAIDKARVKKGRWRYIVVHNSGTRQGNAKAFDYYHRNVRKMPNGLAYHFVIGNGTSSGNGAIEIGNRWVQQLNGGHVHSDNLNNIALGICLVGDYNQDKPKTQQLEALDELIRYLRIRVGKIDHRPAIVKTHKDINPVPTDCPGSKFPYRWLYSRFE